MADANQFMNALFEPYFKLKSGFIEIRVLKPGVTKTYFRPNIQSLSDLLPSLRENVYFGVCPRETNLSGKKTNIKYVVSLWSDIDYGYEGHKKKPKFNTEEEAMAEIARFTLKPSIIVNSGHGFQCYWLLKRPIEITNVAHIEGIIKGISHRLGGDSTQDISRVLRVPGTINIKIPKNPKTVRIIQMNADLRYDLSDFTEYKVPVMNTSNLSGCDFSSQLPDLHVPDLRVSDRIKDLIQFGDTNNEYPSRSERDQAIIVAMITAKHSNDDIKAIFSNTSYVCSDKYLAKANSKDNYLSHSIAKAKEFHSEKSSIFVGKDFNANKVSDVIQQQRKLTYCANQFFEYEDGCYRAREDEEVKKWIKALLKAGYTKRRAEEVMHSMSTDCFIKTDLMNSNKQYLNLKNGLLNLDTYTLEPHNDGLLSSIQLPVKYDPKASCIHWIKTLDEIFRFNNDKTETLQEFFGYSLKPDTAQQKTLINVGEGANGKSVLLSILQNILGKQNYSTITLEQFRNTHYLAELFGKLANISIETSVKTVFDEGTLKAVISGDEIMADQKYKKPFQFCPFARPIFAVNDLPRVEDKSYAFYRRLLIVRYNRIFKDKEQNRMLKNELLGELDGIFLWMLEGLKSLEARGYFRIPRVMKKEIWEYQRENNNVIAFVEEKCEIGHTFSPITKEALHNAYKAWCYKNGYRPLGIIKFGKELKRAFSKVSDSRKSDDRFWTNIALRV